MQTIRPLQNKWIIFRKYLSCFLQSNIWIIVCRVYYFSFVSFHILSSFLVLFLGFCCYSFIWYFECNDVDFYICPEYEETQEWRMWMLVFAWQKFEVFFFYIWLLINIVWVTCWLWRIRSHTQLIEVTMA